MALAEKHLLTYHTEMMCKYVNNKSLTLLTIILLELISYSKQN